MSKKLLKSDDPASTSVLPPDGLPPDAAPPSNPPADPPANRPPDFVLPEPTFDPPRPSENPSLKRPTNPARARKLLKADRTGVGGPKTPAGKARSSRNHLQHGFYSKLPFTLLKGESQDDFDALLADLLTDYLPVDATSNQLLQLLVQARWHIHRANQMEADAYADQSDRDTYFRRVATAGTCHARAERSFRTHLKLLKEHLAAFHAREDEVNEAARVTASRRFNEKGEEMDPRFPQMVFRKFSCDPESQCNEVLEFDRTLAGFHSVKRTALKDWEGGKYLHPKYKPNGMTHEWPEHLLGPWKKHPEQE
jgi:hypothetical protein